jgi:hypothetical protein
MMNTARGGEGMFSTSVILSTVAATVILTPLGIFLMILGAHGPTFYSYAGFAFLLPSLAALNANIAISIPPISPSTLVGLCIFVFLQLAYYYFIVNLLRLLAKK